MTVRFGGVLPFFMVLWGLSACSIAPPGTDIHDPNEAHNREVHEFNRALNERLSSSGGGAGLDIDPELTKPIVNFADNLSLPGMALNGLLQADIAGAATNTVRFVVNSTVGIAGLFDPATAIGLEEEDTDFGETLAVWGAPEGAYIELPVLGPTTERALAGRIADAVLDPLRYVGTTRQQNQATAAKIAALVIKRSQLSGAIDSVYDSADSYAQQRLIYYQNRRFDLGTTTDAVDPYDDLYGE